MSPRYTIPFEALGHDAADQVGAKNASIGEMMSELSSRGVCVPPGFATTADAYRRFIDHNALVPVIEATMASIDADPAQLGTRARSIREAFLDGQWPPDIALALDDQYAVLAGALGQANPAVAVRSSAITEESTEAAFAGQLDTELNVFGEDAVRLACRRCYASLFTDRAIVYRKAHGLDWRELALSVAVQAMVRADRGAAGVMSSIDPETGYPDAVIIDGAYGLGVSVVQGSVEPDEFVLYKPFLERSDLKPILHRQRGVKNLKCIYAAEGQGVRTVSTSIAERESRVLDDADVLTLGRWAIQIESHFGRPMSIEWAKDGITGELAILQARPETVPSRCLRAELSAYRVEPDAPPLLEGLGIGQAVVCGEVCLVNDPTVRPDLPDGAVLVAPATTPDWLPLMRRSAAIVTDHGGRTGHTAIVSRELGLPAVVGTGDATRQLHDQQTITVSCAEGDTGRLYAGRVPYRVEPLSLDDVPETRTRVMLNLADPGAALRWWTLPANGVGLARMEFVLARHVRVHPMALLHPERVEDTEAREQILACGRDRQARAEWFVDALSTGLSRLAAVAYPDPVFVRMSDFTTNEYRCLVGGRGFESPEENPLIGFRGVSRYDAEAYAAGFSLECRAIDRLRRTMGFDNVAIMVPFCRTLGEADRAIAIFAAHGLVRGRDGLAIHMMCEVPSNVVLAGEFASRFDGFSIGSNDLVQLTLGVDRTAERLNSAFDERDSAVAWMMRHAIDEVQLAGKPIGFCGQAPSDDPAFARFLVESGIDSISVSPDSFIDVKRHVAAAEAERGERSVRAESAP